MGGRLGVWVWIFGLLVAAVLAVLRIPAGPWSWDFNHFSLVFLLAAIFLALSSWAVRWMRYGTEGVMLRWNKFGDSLTAELGNKAKMRRYLLVWILVAVALVIYFNMTQQH